MHQQQSRIGQSIRTLILLLIGLVTSLSGIARVQAQTSTYEHFYEERQEVQQFIDEMVRKHGFDKTYLQSLFHQAEQQPKILEAIARPAEKTKTWGEYRDIFVQPDRIEQGVNFYQQHRETLQRAEQQYGVSPAIIVAIIGVETRYGKYRGSYRVLDALTTLGFDYPPRDRFFRQQLEEFLLMVKEQGFDATTLKGSYAGAMGYGQFIPSSFRAYAVDFDQDGVIDIWDNPVDAIGSVANYFKRHGWQQGQAVAGRARVLSEHNRRISNQDLKPKLTLKQLKQAGFELLEPNALPSVNDGAQATIMLLEGKQGEEYWLGLTNFYVITRYNHSPLYAMAVYHLSQEIAKPVEARKTFESKETKHDHASP